MIRIMQWGLWVSLEFSVSDRVLAQRRHQYLWVTCMIFTFKSEFWMNGSHSNLSFESYFHPCNLLDLASFIIPPGDGERQGSLACCSPWAHKGLDTTQGLSNDNNKSSFVSACGSWVCPVFLPHLGMYMQTTLWPWTWKAGFDRQG